MAQERGGLPSWAWQLGQLARCKCFRNLGKAGRKGKRNGIGLKAKSPLFPLILFPSCFEQGSSPVDHVNKETTMTDPATMRCPFPWDIKRLTGSNAIFFIFSPSSPFTRLSEIPNSQKSTLQAPTLHPRPTISVPRCPPHPSGPPSSSSYSAPSPSHPRPQQPPPPPPSSSAETGPSARRGR